MAIATYDEIGSRVRRLAEAKADPRLIAPMIGELVGLNDADGNRYLREDSSDDRTIDPTLGAGYTRRVPTITKAKRRPTDFPFDVLAECIIGRDWKTILGLTRSDKAFGFLEEFRRRPEGATSRFSEESAAPIGPSVWANVAAWSATVGGLMQAQFIEGNKQAQFDVADLFPVKPAVFWQGGERYIDIIGPYKPAPAVGPGEEYPDQSTSALWVEPAPMVKYAGKILVAKETAAIDISGGQLLAKAKEGGMSLKFRENELALDVITGCSPASNFVLRGRGHLRPVAVVALRAGVADETELAHELMELGVCGMADDAREEFLSVLERLGDETPVFDALVRELDASGRLHQGSPSSSSGSCSCGSSPNRRQMLSVVGVNAYSEDGAMNCVAIA
jgi:hypothetical protein